MNKPSQHKPGTLGAWDEDIEKLPLPTLRAYRKALLQLEDWPMFKAQFSWTHIFVLLTSLDYEIARKESR